MIHRSLSGILIGAISLLVPVLQAASPVFPTHPDGTDSPLNIPCGKTLVVPIACEDADGDALTYTVTSSNSKIFARVKTGNPSMKMHVSTTNDGSGAAYAGDMEFVLFRDDTPETAGFIGGFAQAGYYDNLIFHRIVTDFVIQGGDPAGTGSGITSANVDLNLNYKLPNEFRSKYIFSGRGQLAMANSGYMQNFPSNGNFYSSGNFTATNGSQFFMTLAQPRFLDFKHTIFGQLVRGYDVMAKVAAVPATSEKPNVAVKMSGFTVAPSKTDAVLLLSTTTVTAAATIDVTATDAAGNSATRHITVKAVKDTDNDPPLIEALEPTVTPVGALPSVRLKVSDLESDAISTRLPVRDSSTFQTIYATASANVLGIIQRPTAGAWDVTFSVTQQDDPQVVSSPFSISRFEVLEVGVGDRAITATATALDATAAVNTGPVVVATFRHGGSAATAGDFIAMVNWGDGSKREASSDTTPAVSVVPSLTEASTFEVRAAHTYARPGVYPLRVIVDGPNGATKTAAGDAVVSAAGATLRARGLRTEFASAVFTGRPVAYFTDSTPGANATAFTAVVDWGDGTRKPAEVRQIGLGKFAVFGTHKYVDAESYALATHIHRTTNAADAVAWSTVKLSGFTGPRHLPPFPNTNITHYWGEALTKSYRTASATDLLGSLVLINSGVLPSKPWKLKFWLSDDATLGNTDKQLQLGPLTRLISEVPFNSFPAGAGISLPLKPSGNLDYTIHLPSGDSGAGRYIIAQLGYSDPLSDNMDIPKTSVFGPLEGIFVSPPTLTIKEEAPPVPPATASAFTTASFVVRLDMAPTANVVLPLDIVNGSSVVDNSRATLAVLDSLGNVIKDTNNVPVQFITFTPADGKNNHVVKVTMVDDQIKNNTGTFTIRVKPDTTTTDTHFKNMQPADVALTVQDNEPNVLVSPSSVSITEGAAGATGTTKSFTVRLEAAPTANVTFPLDIVRGNTPNVSRAVLKDTAGGALTQLVFTPANGTTAQTVVVTVVDDLLTNGTGSFTVRVKPDTTTTDLRYKDLDPTDVALTVNDNEPNIIASATSVSVTEGPTGDPLTTKSFTLRFDSVPTANVVFPLDIVKGGVVDNSRAVLKDSAGNPLTQLVFTPADATTNHTVIVNSVDDLLANGTGTFSIRIGADTTTSDLRYKNIDPADIALTVLDNEPKIIISASSVSVTEGLTGAAGTTQNFTVRFQSAPTANVTIPIEILSGAVADNSRAVLKNIAGTVITELVFTPADATTAHTVVVTAVDDALVNGTGSFNIRLQADTTTTDLLYRNVKPANLTLSVHDND